jgi:hypothetical protein
LSEISLQDTGKKSWLLATIPPPLSDAGVDIDSNSDGEKNQKGIGI